MTNNYTLITGASSGIGKELARKFASEGHALILVARRTKLLNELAAELRKKYKAKVLSYPCDLTSDEQINTLADRLQQQDIFVNILINNAGVGDFSVFAEADIPKLQQVISLNIGAVVSLTHQLLPDMIANREGKILNVASLAAFSPGPYIAVYAAAKAFVLSFTHALAAELKDSGIQVSVLCPPDVQTGFQENAGLHGFEVPGSITAESLAAFAYESFMNLGDREIIPAETRKTIEMIENTKNRALLTDNMFRSRKLLDQKLKAKEPK